MEKVFGYVRVSTETQNEKGYGIETQKKAIIDYCKQKQFELVNTFYDKGVSGTKADREGLNELFASFNGVDKVIVLNTSRLWREDTAKVLIKRELIKLQVDVISIEQPTYSIYNKDPNDFLLNGIMELLDQYDRMTINVKLARGRRTKAKSGVKGSGEAPFGYKWKKEGIKKPEIIIDSEKAIIIKEIFAQYLKTGSLGKVKKHLDSKDCKTNRGKEFSRQTIYHILTNEFYTGKLLWDNLDIEGSHEILINKITFGKVQAVLTKNNKLK